MRRARGKMNQYAADMERIKREEYQARIVNSAVLGGMEVTLGPMGYYLPSPTSSRQWANWGMCYETEYKAARAWLRQRGITI
jgi:hypothetical protein